ncbi:phospho-2-dehydro-3-deoxyheptonate aldolase [Edwardsiella phage PEi20]|uniref:3-deoxy-7-phosphoheptulonate synthase n=1 Tax=Edwardsiella phage PEi20 TaxID=1608310 RepID=A0A0B6VNZ7_9CAUD|nr:phospho-2-dehydro-3-deoxyheptonate aldolase [Edwardsiella phage PEi20]BAQ22883.1 phospho-2-dehydro-3-deoxyheptonate aldolase [Edwardsiella phage PEi20]
MLPLVESLISPKTLVETYPLTAALEKQVAAHREQVNSIMNGEDPRKIIVVGPCSIHDPKAALEYGERLAEVQKQFPNLLLVMRVYFEKPRTTVGWKGFINDPELNGSFDINRGLEMARELCLELLSLGLPLATEVLDPFTIKYLTGIFSWVAIGARTTESQTHREIASGLPMCVGFKNGTNGSVKVATDAMLSAAYPHRYMGMGHDGKVGIVHAEGNVNTHIVLRGGSEGPNYSESDINEAVVAASAQSLNHNVMVDCSHANATGYFSNQLHVGRLVADNAFVKGIMIESNLHEGNQKISDNMLYGVSITDACIGWEHTEELLSYINQKAI